MKSKNLKPIHKYTFKADDKRGMYNEKGKLLLGHKNEKGYITHEVLCEDGKRHQVLEHRLKYIFFNGEISPEEQIDHIIPIKNGGTNELSNLRKTTAKGNQNNPFSRRNHSVAASKRVGELNPMFGKHLTEEHKNSIMSKIQKAVKRVLENGEIIKYVSAYDASKKTGLSQSSICYACRGCYGSTGHIYKNNEWYYV